MITKIYNFTTDKKVEQVFLEEYDHTETVQVMMSLYNETIEEHVENLKERFSDEEDDLFLIVVKYEATEIPDLDGRYLEIWKEAFQTMWGLKILNPKMFNK